MAWSNFNVQSICYVTMLFEECPLYQKYEGSVKNMFKVSGICPRSNNR